MSVELPARKQLSSGCGHGWTACPRSSPARGLSLKVAEPGSKYPSVPQQCGVSRELAGDNRDGGDAEGVRAQRDAGGEGKPVGSGARGCGGHGEVPRVCSALSPCPDGSPVAHSVPGLWGLALVSRIQAAVTVSKVPATLMVTGTDAASQRSHTENETACWE